jgi:hypothetical protein
MFGLTRWIQNCHGATCQWLYKPPFVEWSVERERSLFCTTPFIEVGYARFLTKVNLGVWTEQDEEAGGAPKLRDRFVEGGHEKHETLNRFTEGN